VGEPACFPGPELPQPPVCPTPLQEPEAGIEGGGDGALAVDREGRLFWAGLHAANPHVPIQVSHDDGLSWSKPFDASPDNSTDREWVNVARDGTVYVTWREAGNSTGPDGLGRNDGAVKMRVSRDHGGNWSGTTTVAPDFPLDGPTAIDNDRGLLYVPTMPLNEGTLRVYRSLDQGATWLSSPVPSRNETGPVTQTQGSLRGFIFPVAAVDAAGTAYVAWAEDASLAADVPSQAGKLAAVPHVYLAVSRDQGATWSEPRMVSPPDRAAMMPAMVAGDAGQVALAWYESVAPLPSESVPDAWHVAYAQSAQADAPDGKFVESLVTPDVIHVGTMCTNGLLCLAGGDRSRGDFFEMTLDARGLPVVAWVKDSTYPGGGALEFGTVMASVASAGTPLRAPS
jgi:hypothetical protein